MRQKNQLDILVINAFTEAENATLSTPDESQLMLKNSFSEDMNTLVSKNEHTQSEAYDELEEDTSYPGCSCCRPR